MVVAEAVGLVVTLVMGGAFKDVVLTVLLDVVVSIALLDTVRRVVEVALSGMAGSVSDGNRGVLLLLLLSFGLVVVTPEEEARGSDTDGCFRPARKRRCESMAAFFLADGVRVRLLRRDGVATVTLLLLRYKDAGAPESLLMVVVVVEGLNEDGSSKGGGLGWVMTLDIIIIIDGEEESKLSFLL